MDRISIKLLLVTYEIVFQYVVGEVFSSTKFIISSK